MFVSQNKTPFIICLFFSFLTLTACISNRQARIYNDFIIVTPGLGDTEVSLAKRYLKNPSQSWIISEFNESKPVNINTELVIPLHPFNKGGLKINGYQTVPVLAYHKFSNNTPEKLTVTRAQFENQMTFLKENNYHVITLNEFSNFLEYKEQIPKQSVVITIDDGWESFYTIAYPILKKFNFPATIFIYTDFIGQKKALSWKQLKKMSQNRISIQSLTKTHRNIAIKKKNESFKEYFNSLEKEISESQLRIKQKLNSDCKFMAYPYGSSCNIAIELLKKYNYLGAFTLNRGGNPFFIDKFKINRSMIYGTYDIDEFKKNLIVFNELALK